MNKLLTLIYFNFLFIGAIYSQVMISDVIKGEILLGPKNVNAQNEEVATRYFSKIEAFKNQLNTEQESLIIKTKALQGKKRLRKNDKELINEYQLQLSKLQVEEDLVNSLLADWMRTIKRNKLLFALSLLEEDDCFEVNTNKGIYLNNAVEINKINPPNQKYEAFIPISSFEKKVEKGKWVRKKKSPNCFSQNPDDCYVACYEKYDVKIITYLIEDMEGKMVELDAEPLNMKCTQSSEMCYIVNPRKNKALSLQLTSKMTGEDLEIIGLKKIACADD